MVIAKQNDNTNLTLMTKQIDTRIPHEMRPESIGIRLRLIREAFGLSKSEISDLLGIERTYWSRFENGKRAPSDEVSYLMTVKFGVTLDYLILGRWDKLSLDIAEKLREVEKAGLTSNL